MTGFVGAALLITSGWPWSVIGLSAAAALFYVTLVISTYNDRRRLAKWIRFERERDPDRQGRPGRILLSTASVMGFAPWEDADAGPVWYGMPGEPGALRLAEGVQRIADEQARLSWAIRHPYGTTWWSPRLFRTWLIIRLGYMIGKPV